jgi:hypothetical protein
MNTKEKRLGTKAQLRAIKNRERRIATAILLAFILLIVILSSYFTYNFLNQPQNQTTNPASSQLKAAIVDQLSLTFPNQTFIETATNTLKQAGYSVDYYPGEKVTVEFYRNLPTHGYGLIILRVHSTATTPDRTEDPVTLFTSERYDRSKHVYEQLTDQLALAAFSQDEMKEGITYFGINPPFITQGMNGKFQNTIIIMMGCEGLDNPLMAEAFVEKGAKVYVSWNQPVSASHTDTATTQLLQHFLIEKLTLKQSVQETFKEVGFDPIYKSLLIYYPLEVGDYTIQNIIAVESF